MSRRDDAVPPFGTYALTGREIFARKWGAHLRDTPAHRLCRSALWRYARGIAQRPRDVALFQNQRARLHPYDNICEKRIFLTPQLWEPRERAILHQSICDHPSSPFYFVDAGANVGLYSLFARDCAMTAGKLVRCLAIEPGQQQLSRLYTNIALSGAKNEITVAPVGLAGAEGTASFAPHNDNLGESRVSDRTDQSAIDIRVHPLTALIAEHDFPRIDALKMDIEGAEPAVLSAFFEQAARRLWPRLMIIEIAHAPDSMDLLNLAGYAQTHRRRGLAVYHLPE